MGEAEAAFWIVFPREHHYFSSSNVELSRAYLGMCLANIIKLVGDEMEERAFEQPDLAVQVAGCRWRSGFVTFGEPEISYVWFCDITRSADHLSEIAAGALT
jgi:hypothetical protein